MIFYSILAILFGVALIMYAHHIYNFVGTIDFLEKYFGNTKTGIQFVGLFIIILVVLVTTGGLNFFLKPLFGVTS